MELSRFLKDVATLVGGRAGAAGIGIFAMPVISRLFHPDVFGVAALYISITSILASIGILSFPNAVVLPDDDSKAAELLGLTFVSLFIVAIILWLCLLGARVFGFEVYSEFGLWLWTLPLAMGLQGLLHAGDNWITRQRKFRRSAAGDICQSALTSGTRITCGLYFGSQLWPLISGYLIGQLGRLAVYRNIFTTVAAHLKGCSTKNLVATAVEYRKFPIYNMPAALIFVLNAQLPVLAIGYLFSPTELGYYAMAQGLIVTATMLAGHSVRRVYLHRTTQNTFTNEELRVDYRRTLGLMGGLALPPAAILAIYGETLFAFLLGDEWVDVGKYAAVLVPWFYMQWLSVPAAALVISLKRQRFWFYFQQLVLAGTLFGIAVGYSISGSIFMVLAGYVFARSALLLFLIIRIDSMIARRTTV